MKIYNKLKEKLFHPVDPASLSVFRIGFGLILLWDIWRYYHHDWISAFYIEPDFYFKYYGFEWVQPWAGDGMYIHFAVMGVLAFMIMIGLFYRISIVLFTLAFSYMFLLDQTRYLNHFYMVILFGILLCVAPAARKYSIDALRKPTLKTNTIPAWSLWCLRIQLEIILLYAGIVKINPDWLRLQPLRMWLESRSDLPLIGDLFLQDWAVALAAYGVILLHLIGAPLLLWKKTRLVVLSLYAIFHTLNHFVFNIGIFPWFTLFASLLFFDSNWPIQLRQTIQKWVNRYLFHNSDYKSPVTTNPATVGAVTPDYLVTGFLLLWFSTQLLIPLRHLLYPGNVNWTEEGHRFSWRMKLRDKYGVARFVVTNPQTLEKWHVDLQEHLTRKQIRKMSTRPDMILQFAHYLEQYWDRSFNMPDVEVHAQVYASLNGRKPALLINPEIDLTTVPRNLKHAEWIMPLSEPFRWIDRNS